MKTLIIATMTLLLAGCAQHIKLNSRETLTFPKGSKFRRVDVEPGDLVLETAIHFRDEMSQTAPTLNHEIQDKGTVIIVDEYPQSDYEHSFTVLFVSEKNPTEKRLIFRGPSFPIRIDRK